MIEEIDLVKQAASAASAASERAAVTLAELTQLEELAAASDLLNSIWAVPTDRPMLATELLRALSKAGSYVVGARSEGRLVGAIVGLLGLDDSGYFLHSHILGVLPESQGRSVGFALKQHQRYWALERGMKRVTWTFDPLVRRNAFFNISKLGAEATNYYLNFYGEMTDGVNSGDRSDRILIEWWLDSDRAMIASEGGLEEPDTGERLSNGAVRILSEDPQGMPEFDGRWRSTLLCAVPNDIVALRLKDPPKAAAWRRELRRALGGALESGYVVSEFARSGYYVLTKRKGRI